MLVHPFQIKGNATCQRVQKICGVFGSILHFLRAILPTNAAAAENWITAQNLYGVPLMVFRYYSAVNAFARNPIVRFEPIRFYRFFQSGGRVSSGAVDNNSTRSTISLEGMGMSSLLDTMMSFLNRCTTTAAAAVSVNAIIITTATAINGTRDFKVDFS